jgi:2-polyprenyl-3-methyl-5-hydroxy-6-metoxy-1,4-benzoquinol methylase
MNSEVLYSKIDNSYHATMKLAGYTMAVDYFVKRIPIETDRPIQILDAGCGTGFYSMALLKRFPNARIVAFDLNENMIEEMKANLEKNGLTDRVEVFRADLIRPLSGVNGDSFDVIITAGVLEYVAIEKAVKNLSQHLTEAGYWLNVPIKTNLFGQMIGKIYRLRPYTRDRNIKAFERNGLKLQKIVDFLALKEAHLFQKPAISVV